MTEIVIAGAAIALLVLWAISCRRKLAVLDENVNNAMAQIGIQLASRFDVLTALLDLVQGYAGHELQALIETVRARRSDINPLLTPEDVLSQEGVIADALERISAVAERYPDLKASENYMKCMNAVDSYESMVRTSRLIYNDSVTKLNRELRMFPSCIVGRAIGFRQRGYLEEQEGKTDMPAADGAAVVIGGRHKIK